MIPLHKQVENIANEQEIIKQKLDELINYIKPSIPEPQAPNPKDQLDQALSQIDGLSQVLVDKAEALSEKIANAKK